MDAGTSENFVPTSDAFSGKRLRGGIGDRHRHSDGETRGELTRFQATY